MHLLTHLDLSILYFTNFTLLLLITGPRHHYRIVHHDQRPRWGSSLLVSWLHGNRISSAEADSLSSSSLLCSVSESRASLLNRGINTDSTVMPPDSLHINACQPFIITSGTVVRHRVNGNHAFLWEMAKFDPHRIKTPSLVDIKLWKYDCVWELCPKSNFVKKKSV